MINNHIADLFDVFYKNKISLPYSETVGVGAEARRITCNSREELLSFLRSEQSLCTYSNYQELLAISNILNTKIHVFTYGIGGDEASWSWNTISPDPDMTQYSEFAQGTVPEMYLYNSDNTHFDLLIEDNSRLAVMGLISMGEEQVVKEVKEVDKEVQEKEVQEKECDSHTDKADLEVLQNLEWKTVKSSKPTKNHVQNEGQAKVLADSEEQVLLKHKQNGHKREGPQSPPNLQAQHKQTVNLEEQIEKLNITELHCKICKDNFESKVDFESHMKIKHSKQWNCDQCAFQASTRTILMNHCKITQGHKPANHKQRLGETGVIECYTCRGEFRNYHDLMNHRKEEHPSHKKCRYYLKGECKFSSHDCWYIHEDEQTSSNNTGKTSDELCYVCKKSFPTKYDMMEHKKKNHPSQIPCKNFEQGDCDRSSDECWNKHVYNTTHAKSISPPSNMWAQHLPSVQQTDFYQPPPAVAPDQGAVLKALEVLNKKLQTLEARMFPRLN